MGIDVIDNEILNNIMNHMKIKDVRQTDVEFYLGISDNAVSKRVMYTSKSYMIHRDKLVDFFDVATDEPIHTSKKNIYEHYFSQEEQSLPVQY